MRQAGSEFYAVIPAGGSGTRLWPLSRAGNPKFLHALTGSDDSLLQATVRRLEPLAGSAHTYVVTGASHATAVARQLPELPADNIIVEPSPRDSCAAIGLAAAIIASRDPNAVMGSFAADHLVRQPADFEEAIRAAMAGALDGFLMTIGIKPTHPETGYGYLHTGELVGPGPVRRVAEFAEKPSREVAVEYLRSGAYLWNASMFVWRVDAFLAELRRQQPDLYEGLTAIATAWGTEKQDAVMGEVWPSLKKISVDYAVMEGAAAAGRVATVPGDFGWHDIGDFHTLGDVVADLDDSGNVVIGNGDAEVLLHDTSGVVVVPGSGRLVAALGVQDLILVDTADAVLVCPRDRAQDVKKLVDRLKESGAEDYL